MYDLEEYDDYPRTLFPFLSDVLIKTKLGVNRHAYFIRDYSYLPHYANLSRTDSCKQLYINGSELLSDFSLLDIFRAFKTLISLSLISFDLHAHHETLEQMSLMVKRNQQSLKRLAVTDGFFNRLLIDGVAEPLALDFLALNLAAADLDFMRFNQYLIHTTSLTHLKIDRLIELPIPLCLGNIKKFDVCFDAAIESSKQSRYNLLETLRLSTGLEKLSLEIRNTRHLVEEYWPIQINLKGLKKLKIEYMNNQFSWIKFSSLLGPLMAEDVVIEELDLYLVHFTPFTEIDQHCLTKFVEISFNFCRLDNAFQNITFPKLQKLNFLCSNQFTMSTGFENCEFPALTHLCFEGHNISLETIKRIIRAAPNLQFVVINQHASKMDEELDKMLSAIPNHVCVFQNNTNLDDDNSDDASEMTDNQDIVSTSAAAEIRPTVSKASTCNSFPLDARTSLEQNSAPLSAKKIFRGENGEEPAFASYRLNVYDEMRLDNFENIFQQTSENDVKTNLKCPLNGENKNVPFCLKN